MSSYQVIARKWRPGVFEEVVGQTHITRTLRNAIASGRVAHAYLFSGPRGVGKTTAARILAKCLNCEGGPTVTPCGACESCKGITSGSSVDVFEIDGASNNSVDNIREISESVRYVPSLGKYKVYIIDEVHMLSTAAFNALLKTLEEPPPHAIFIFATTEVHKIPATILSRCQRFDFKRIPFRDIQAHLKKIVVKEGVAFEDEALFLLAREADGSLRDSQSLLEQSLAFAGGELKARHVAESLGLMDRSILFEISEAIVGKDPAACLNIVEKVYEFGYDLKRATSDLLEHFRDLTVLKVTGEASLLDLPDCETERLEKISSAAGAERLQMIFSIISRGYEEVSRSAHPRYALEMALLKAAHFDEIEPLGELVAKLEGLASKVGQGAPGGNNLKAAPLPFPASNVRPAAVPWKKKDSEPVARKAPAKAEGAQDPGAVIEAVETEEGAPEAKTGPDNGLLEFIGNRNKELAGLMAGASIAAEGDAVNITVAARFAAKLGTFHRPSLEACLRDFYGRPVSAVINGNGASVASAPGQKKEADPVLKDALRILGGRIIEDRRGTNV